MSGFKAAIRITGDVLLAASELVLIGIYAACLASDSGGAYEAACLLIHCTVVMLSLGTYIYTLWRKKKDPADATYILSGAKLLLFTTAAAGVFTFRFTVDHAKETDFQNLRNPLYFAYTALILSWVSTLLALECLIFACTDKYYASRLSSSARQRQAIDWTQRPLPLKIIDVKHGVDPTIFNQTARKLNSQTRPPPRTAYDHWPEIGLAA